MEIDFAELLDRFTITLLKKERIGGEEIEKFYVTLGNEISKRDDIPDAVKDNWIERLYITNKRIWDLESDIRKGKEGQLGLEEVGRRAIQIRDINKLRVTIKNEIIDALEEGFKDVKMNHCSQ